MRIRVPLVPLTITIERRPWEPFRWRLSIRGLLVLVVLVAVALIPFAESRKEYCRRRILYHSVEELVFLRRILQYERSIEEARRAGLAASPAHLQAIEEYRPLAEYHRNQIRRYQRAAYLPWVSLAPDPGSVVSQSDLSDPKWERRYAEEFARMQRLRRMKLK
jgi:hypothetical protein